MFQNTGLQGTLTIPPGVVSIGADAFRGLGSITKLELPESGSLSIGSYAFGETGLSGAFTIPSSVTSIGGYAFFKTGLSGTLTIPSSVTSIGENAFMGLGITKLVLPESGSLSIGSGAFQITGLNGTLTIPSGVTSIGGHAFAYVSGITNLELPQDGSLSIGDSAFIDTGLRGTLTVPPSVTSIGNMAFCDISGITKLELPQTGSLSIGDSAFRNTGLQGTLTIPASVTGIGENTFRDCGSLTAVNFSAYTGSLGRFVVSDCSKLSSLTFMQNPAPSFHSEAFHYLPSSGTVYYPAGAEGYTPDGFASGRLSGWTFTSIPVRVPSAPSITQATPDREAISFSWSAATNGGSGILRYQYSVSSGGDNWITADNGQFGATVSGLSRGTEYTIKVRAVNNVGNGAEAIRRVTTLADPPQAPQNMRVTPGKALLELTWDAPASNGGSKILKYQYSVSTTGTDDWKDIPGSNSSTTKYTLEGLEGNAAYYVKVRAVNRVSEGPAVETSATTLPKEPSAPMDLKAIPGNGEITFTWKTPESSGGAEITGYEKKFYLTGSVYVDIWFPVPESDGSTTSYTVTGLENGKEYTLELRAVNSAGGGTKATVKAAPEATVPSAPQSLKPVIGDRQVTLSWKAPESDGGAPITKYQYKYQREPMDIRPSEWEDIPNSNVSTTSYTITGLKNDKSYTLKIRAVNSAGEGEEIGITISSCKGTVKTKDSSPLSGIQVTVWEGSRQVGRTLTTDETGDFSTLIAQGRYTVKAGGLADNGVCYAEQSKNIYVVLLPESVDFELEPAAPPLSFTDSDSYDIPASTVGEAIAEINVSGGASGGKTPYAFTATGLPAGVSISGAGVISGTPTEEAASGTATVIVIDAAGAGKEITINYGEIAKPAPEQVGSLVFSPAGGTYDSPQSVEITCATEGASIYYTTDESKPTSGSTPYSDSVTVDSSLTLKAIAVKDGMTDSEIAQAEYTIQSRPELSGEIKVATNGWKSFLNKLTLGLFFKDIQEVSIDHNGVGSITVEYFTSGEDLSEDAVRAKSEGWQLYSAPFPLTPDADVVVYARISDSTKTICLRSDRITLDSTKPVFSLQDGETYDSAQTLTISDNYALASVQRNGEEQLPADFTGKEKPLTLDTNGTYTITAEDKAKNKASITVTIAISAAEQAAKPVFNPAGGSYNSAQSVVISCDTESAKIYYTTDGSDPSTSSTEYTGPVTVDSSMTIKSIAVKDGMADSGIAQAVYTIENVPTHLHSWAQEWSSDSGHHWHECTTSGCPITENSGKEGHDAHHESEWITTLQPTETEAGSKKKECIICKRELATEEIPATGPAHIHSLTHIAVKEATCVEEGHTEYWYCGGCGKYFSDSAGANEIERSTTVTPATGAHTGAGEWKTDDTSHWKRCSVCGQQTDNEAHSGGTANCHAKAVCEVCSAKYGALAPDNHDGDTEIRNKKQATETEDGYTGDTYCKGCNKLISTGTTIPATGEGHTHTFGGEWKKDATHHWKLCTAGDGEIGNKAAHTASEWIDEKPLSENELSRRHQECTVCGYKMGIAVTIKADGIVEVKPGKDSNWTFYGDFKDLNALRLNGVEMGIMPMSETSASLTYPGYKGIAGIAKAGSVEVTLYADFLKTLPAGTYTLETELASGETKSTGSTKFTVNDDNKPRPTPDHDNPTSMPDHKPTPDLKQENSSDVPATGDTRPFWPWVLLMLAALAGCGTLIFGRKLARKLSLQGEIK